MLGEDMATAHEELEMATEYWDEDCGEQLNLADAESGMKRGQQLLMENLDEVPRVDVPRDARKGTGRWRLRKKAGGVRSRYVIHQYAAEAWNEDAFSGNARLGLRTSALHDCTLADARSSDRRIQRGVHAHATGRERAHPCGTTARMGKRRRLLCGH